MVVPFEAAPGDAAAASASADSDADEDWPSSAPTFCAKALRRLLRLLARWWRWCWWRRASDAPVSMLDETAAEAALDVGELAATEENSESESQILGRERERQWRLREVGASRILHTRPAGYAPKAEANEIGPETFAGILLLLTLDDDIFVILEIFEILVRMGVSVDALGEALTVAPAVALATGPLALLVLVALRLRRTTLAASSAGMTTDGRRLSLTSTLAVFNPLSAAEIEPAGHESFEVPNTSLKCVGRSTSWSSLALWCVIAEIVCI